MSTDEARSKQPYESPTVDELPTEDGPAVTAAGDSVADQPTGAEWQPAAGANGPQPSA
jgi:hypothetical protein